MNKEKFNYLTFTCEGKYFAARFTLNNTNLDRKYGTKLFGVWLEEDGGWAKNTSELCKRSYAKLSTLTKLKYAGVCNADLLGIYKLFNISSA